MNRMMELAVMTRVSNGRKRCYLERISILKSNEPELIPMTISALWIEWTV